MKNELSELDRDTAAYFANMTEEEAREERELEVAICSSTFPIDVDVIEDQQDDAPSTAQEHFHWVLTRVFRRFKKRVGALS